MERGGVAMRSATICTVVPSYRTENRRQRFRASIINPQKKVAAPDIFNENYLSAKVDLQPP